MKKYVISIWHDPFWHSSFKKSYKRRKYWIHKYPVPSNKGKAFAIQLLDYTIKILIVRKQDG